MYSLFKQITQAPAEYGFTNVTTQSQGFPVNPDQYLFWDYLHPTTKMHQVIANLVLSDVTRGLGTPSAQTRLPVSDEFTANMLDPNLWTVEAPPDATVSVTNGHAVLTVPGGANHDPFLGGNQSARILQPVSDVDLDVAVKFDSVPNSASAGQGILVQQDNGTYLRFEIDSTGTQLLFQAQASAAESRPTTSVPHSPEADRQFGWRLRGWGTPGPSIAPPMGRTTPSPGVSTRRSVSARSGPSLELQ